MSFSEITQSTGWKMFMAKLYGLGAAVVIVGALFKIMHWPGAGLMLTIGLATEAVIFIFSAFEPLHEELDWTLVYPELAGMTDPDELDSSREQVSKSNAALERFDDLMGGLGGIDPTLIKNLGNSFDKLNEAASGISDVSQASAVTSQYVQNVGAAAESVGGLSYAFQQSAAGLQQSASAIQSSSTALSTMNDSSQDYVVQMDNMNKTIAQLAESVVGLSNMFQQSTTGLQQSTELVENSTSALTAINDSSYGYVSQLKMINDNMSQLNAVYEMQLRNTTKQMQKAQDISGDMEQMMENIKMSVEETQRYREEMSSLNRNLSSLNTIYGNMLSAMSVRV